MNLYTEGLDDDDKMKIECKICEYEPFFFFFFFSWLKISFEYFRVRSWASCILGAVHEWIFEDASASFSLLCIRAFREYGKPVDYPRIPRGLSWRNFYLSFFSFSIFQQGKICLIFLRRSQGNLSISRDVRRGGI